MSGAVQSDFNIGHFILTHSGGPSVAEVLVALETSIRDVVNVRLYGGAVVSARKEDLHRAVESWARERKWKYIPYSIEAMQAQKALALKVIAFAEQAEAILLPESTPGEFVQMLGLDQLGCDPMQDKIVVCDAGGVFRFYTASSAQDEDKILSENPATHHDFLRRVLNLACEALEKEDVEIALQIFSCLMGRSWVPESLRGDDDVQSSIDHIAQSLSRLVERCEGRVFEVFEDAHIRLSRSGSACYDSVKAAVARTLQYYDTSACAHSCQGRSSVLAVLLPEAGPRTLLRYLELVAQRKIKLVREDGGVVVFEISPVEEGEDTESGALLRFMEITARAFEEPDRDTALQLLSALSRLQNLSLRDGRIRIEYEKLVGKGLVVFNGKFERFIEGDHIKEAVDLVCDHEGCQWVMMNLRLPGPENLRFIELQGQLASRIQTIPRAFKMITEALQYVDSIVVRLKGMPVVEALLQQPARELCRLKSTLEKHQRHESVFCGLVCEGTMSSCDVSAWRKSRRVESMCSEGGSSVRSFSTQGGSHDSLSSASSFGFVHRGSMVNTSLSGEGELFVALCRQIEVFFANVSRYIEVFEAYPVGSAKKSIWDDFQELEIQGHRLLEPQSLMLPAIDRLDLEDLQVLYEAMTMMEELLRGDKAASEMHQEARKLVDIIYHLQEYRDLSLLVEAPRLVLFVREKPFFCGEECFKGLCDTGDKFGRKDVVQALFWAAATERTIPEFVWPKIVGWRLKMGNVWEEVAEDIRPKFSELADQRRWMILASHLGMKYRITKAAIASEKRASGTLEQVLGMALDPKNSEETMDAAMDTLHDYALSSLSRVPIEEWYNYESFQFPELVPHLSHLVEIHLALQYNIKTFMFSGIVDFRDQKSLRLIGYRVYRLMQMIERALSRADYCTAHLLHNVYNGDSFQRIVAPNGNRESGVFKYLTSTERSWCQRMHEWFEQCLNLPPVEVVPLALAAGLSFTVYPERVMHLVRASTEGDVRTSHSRQYVEKVALAGFYMQDVVENIAAGLGRLRTMEGKRPKTPDKAARDQADRLFNLTMGSIVAVLDIK